MPRRGALRAQGVALACRLSCSTPGSSLVGFVGVSAASAVAGQASAAFTRWRKDGAH